MNDDLGKRMKENYEHRSRIKLPRRSYTILRIDGKSFHTYTNAMERPYSKLLRECMDRAACYVFKNIMNAKYAYIQSDEISILMYDGDRPTTEAWFDNNIAKMTSVSASMATTEFNKAMIKETLNNTDYQRQIMQETLSKHWAEFDCRVFQIPDPVEVANYFIWRQKDAIRNSVQLVAQSLYSHKELHGKKQAELHDMIHAKGQNWANYDEGFKNGRDIYMLEVKKSNLLTDSEITIDAEDETTLVPVLGVPPVYTQQKEYLTRAIPNYPEGD